ncbi:MAG: HNH endonuclease [Calditrichia bacterium]
MIRIDRNRANENGTPIRPNQQWVRSAATATQTAIREGAAHSVSNLYKDTQVRVALEELFYDKCAYCEWKMNPGADWDVEHYRPKGRVAERDNHPGYYWLAYTWDNLYPSCQHCNQRRTDKARWGDLAQGPAAGKLDQFPIVDEQNRAMMPNSNLNNEEPLLLDPCNDSPEEYLGFNLLGEIYEINNNTRGKATIAVCNLNRRRLIVNRLIAVKRVIELIKVINELRTDNHIEAADQLEQNLLQSFIDDSSEYAGAARFVTNNHSLFGLY